MVLLDLSAAFDTVNHVHLLSILETSGITGTSLAWFKSYLSSRTQRIYINGHTSDSRQINCGVPQGSILGPILFTLYTSSLGNLIHNCNIKYHLYADDTQLYTSFAFSDVDDALDQMQNCIHKDQIWMKQHNLKKNEEKTEFLIISFKRTVNQLSEKDMHK